LQKNSKSKGGEKESTRFYFIDSPLVLNVKARSHWTPVTCAVQCKYGRDGVIASRLWP